MTSKDLEANLNNLGRVVCIKLNNTLDALSIFAREIPLNLPLNNGKYGEPIVCPSRYLLNIIDQFNQQTSQSQIQSAGK